MANWNRYDDWVWTENKYGERPIDDVNAIVRLLIQEVGRDKATMCLEPKRLRNQIVDYLSLRHRKQAHEISVPYHDLNEPRDWTPHAEEVWTDWVQHVFPPERWTSRVLEPVFGTDDRFWEAHIGPRWRMELYDMLQWWIQRSWAAVEKFDPLPDDRDGTTSDDEGDYDTI
jgi:hypothetical protein